ncbi:TPR Domain containing protein [Trichomonas vaginalis G3]|uniref:Intraflagellar transport protein 56 n=1 Tax=Trichomonas vaginalis (strain ATCC PRA-98 / G3) TaxID=412133 RepID=A2EI66_TRIV3|nr:hypothetical protein TVAGG3_0858870 [Trichomonas vaginalis G3]EAY07626.1 TPR Domain containing protein [Trichomonas vaginalis G3]KAI5500526.1 hypothetical protein TVAGG3_0858870 [Trichomonas vaginalis G3]|eukprot:XP_001319849.1 TPR Domain containing protein [Trichomonas vaginalis G3]
MFVGGKRTKNLTAQTVQPEDQLPDTPIENIETIINAVDQRNYSAAITYIQFLEEDLNLDVDINFKLWKGYCLFHQGKYQEAIDLYNQMLEKDPNNLILHLYISSCLFYLKEFDEAKAEAEKGPQCDYKTRLLFHIAHQQNDEELLFQSHSKLVGTLENQLSLAAIHFQRSNYQEGIDLYQKLLAEHPDYIALNVYIAMCLFKLEKYQESNDIVDEYLGINSDSAVGLNLKSCDYFKLFPDPSVAESQILQIKKFGSASYTFVDELIQHNLCVFSAGVDGYKVFPKLIGVVPEAKNNLATLYIKDNNADEAYQLLEDFKPSDVNDFILKGTVLLEYGQNKSDVNLIEEANQIFSIISEMEDIKDTVISRCAMATTTFINGDFYKTLKIMETFKHVLGVCEEFIYDEGMANAVLENWKDAEECFAKLENSAYKSDPSYMLWYAKTLLKNKKYEQAWQQYLNATQTETATSLLQIIASECYLNGEYVYAMRAYDTLNKVDFNNAEYAQGLAASAAGAFKRFLNHQETPDVVTEILGVLGSDPTFEKYYQIIQNFIDQNPERFQFDDM